MSMKRLGVLMVVGTMVIALVSGCRSNATAQAVITTATAEVSSSEVQAYVSNLSELSKNVGKVGVIDSIKAITLQPYGGSVDYAINNSTQSGILEIWNKLELSTIGMSMDVESNLPGYAYAMLDSKGEYALVAFKGKIIYNKLRGGVQK